MVKKKRGLANHFKQGQAVKRRGHYLCSRLNVNLEVNGFHIITLKTLGAN